MLINKVTWEKDPQFLYDGDILGTSLDNYPDYYIFTDGSVYSNKRNRFLKGCNDGNGYLQIGLSNKDGEGKFLTHRLVALTFIPNPENKPQVDHIDRDKTNNNISNLRWCDRYINSQNRGVSKNNKSGIKNIYYCKRDDIWKYKRTIRGNRFNFANKNKNIVLWCKFVKTLCR